MRSWPCPSITLATPTAGTRERAQVRVLDGDSPAGQHDRHRHADGALHQLRQLRSWRRAGRVPYRRLERAVSIGLATLMLASMVGCGGFASGDGPARYSALSSHAPISVARAGLLPLDRDLHQVLSSKPLYDALHQLRMPMRLRAARRRWTASRKAITRLQLRGDGAVQPCRRASEDADAAWWALMVSRSGWRRAEIVLATNLSHHPI